MAIANLHLARLADSDRQLLESWLLEFDQSWDESRLAARVKQLPVAGHPLRLPALIELAKIDLERQWQRGRRAVVEAYVKFYPELGTAETASVDLILAEYQVRRQFGAAANVADFGRRFPRQAEALRKLIDQVSAPSSEPARDYATKDSLPQQPSTVPDARIISVPQSLPEEFGRYRILKKLGKGGMGTVYLARDTQLDRSVALKVPHFGPEDGPEVLDRFYREARAAATIEHPNICLVHDVASFNGIHYLTMTYIEGKPLSEFVKDGKPLSQKQAATLVRKLALALQEAHERQVIHRDLKPSNIMINQRGEPIIMDFGLARRVQAGDVRLTRSGSVLGTPAYMPPEQVSGDVHAMGPGCDIYSLGVVLYELLTSKLPFQGTVMSMLSQILSQPPEPPSKHRPDLDPQLGAICLKALAKKVEDRFPSMSAMAAALDAYFDKGLQPGAAARPTPPTPPQGIPSGANAPGSPGSPSSPPQAIPVMPPPLPPEAMLVEEQASMPQRISMPGPAEPLSVMAMSSTRAGRPLLWLAGPGIGVLVLLAVIYFVFFRSSGPSPEVIEKMAVDSFNQGVEAFEAKKWVLAQDSFEEAARLKPNYAAALFYLGRIHYQKGRYPKAVELFIKTLDLDPKYPETYYYRARAYAADRNYAKAIDDYNKVILENPKNNLARVYLAEAHIEQGHIQEDDIIEIDEGRGEVNKALKADDKLALGYAIRADAYCYIKDIKQALDDCDKALELDPNLALAYAVRGKAELIRPGNKEYKKAIDDCTKAIELDKRLVKGYLYLGNAYHAKGDLEQAVAEYTEAIRLDPNYSAARVARGESFNRQQKFARAVKDFKAAIRLAPNYVGAYDGRGLAFQAKKDYSSAIADFSKALEMKPRSFVVLCNRGNSYRLAKELDKAQADYEKALKIEPKNAYVFNGLGLIYQDQKNDPLAIANYKTAIDLNSRVADFHANLGTVYFQKNEDAKALDHFRNALLINKKHAFSYYMIARVNATKPAPDYDLAIKNYDLAIEYDPDRGHYYRHLGEAYTKKLSFPKAVEAFIKSGEVFLAKEDFGQARESFNKAIEIDAKAFKAYHGLGTVCLETKQYDGAINILTDAIKISSQYAGAYHNRGKAHAGNKDYGQAIDDYSEAIKIYVRANKADPQLAEAYHNRGQAYAAKNNFTKAIDEFTEAIRINDQNPAFYLDRAEVLAQTGEPESAQKDREKAGKLEQK